MFAFLKTTRSSYRRIFSIRELEENEVVKWFFGASLLFFFQTFASWVHSSSITVETARSGTAVCWPYFESCYRLYFLHALPYGYSQTTFYMVLYGIMATIVWRMWKADWVGAHALMLLLFLWKCFVIFVLSYTIAGPYDYYHVILTAVLLFVPFKEYFLKLTFVFLYFMSVTTKFDDTWILGTYFTTLKNGLPLFPTILTVPLTNLVIFMQVIGAWFLLSKNTLLQRLSFTYFLIFHLYSGVLVLYTYPTISVTSLLVLFGPLYRHSEIPFSPKALGGWVIIALVALFQIPGFLISADRRMSLEGNRFGMFMFEANHECIVHVSTYRSATSTPDIDHTWRPITSSCTTFYCLTAQKTITSATSSVTEQTYESGDAWNRCDPYEWWARLHLQCGKNDITGIGLREDHSINGGPFYEIVNVPNICDVTYQPFSHNDWIKLPPQAPIIGYPVTDWYRY